jgi:U3 small nucleolar RNA-associated protein 14
MYITVLLITTDSPIDTEELHIRPDDYIQVNCQKNEVYEAFAGDNISVEFDEDKEDVATQKVQLTMPGEYLN